MSLAYGAKWINASAAANKPHVFGFTTARSVANDLLLAVWNGATKATEKFAVDLLGKPWTAAYAAGDIPYAATVGGVTTMRRLDSLAIGTAGQVLQVNSGATAPEWTSSPTLSGTLTLGTSLKVGSYITIGASTFGDSVEILDAGGNSFTANRFSATATAAGTVSLGHARGSVASPAVTAADDILSILRSRGYDGVGWVTSSEIRIYAHADFSATNRGSYFSFVTCANGSLSPTQRWLLDETNLRPYADNTYDLGSATRQPRNVYVGTSLVLAGATVTYGANDSGGTGYKVLRVPN